MVKRLKSIAKKLDVLEKFDTTKLVKIHKTLTYVWFVLAFPICIFFPTSVPLLVFVSVYANVAGHWSSWQASRTEVLQEEAKES